MLRLEIDTEVILNHEPILTPDWIDALCDADWQTKHYLIQLRQLIYVVKESE